MFDGLLGGKIYGTPQQRTGKNNNTFVVAKMRVPVAEGEALFASLIAFDSKACAELMALRDGDAISVAGAVTVKVWEGSQDGKARPAVDVVVSQVLSVYAIKKKRDKSQGIDEEHQPHRGGSWGQTLQPQQHKTKDDAWQVMQAGGDLDF